MARRGGEPVPIRGLLGGVLGKFGTSSALPLTQARQAFERALPDEWRGRMHLASLKNGVGTVEVDSAALAYELRGFLGEELLGRLKAQEGGEVVRRLRFKVGAQPE